MLSSKLLGLNRWHASHEYLDPRCFLLTLLAAVFLHLFGMYAWSWLPKMEVVDVPVNVLNIKLSDSEEMSPAELKAIEPNAANNATVENTVSRLVRDQDPENVARTQTVVASMDKAMSEIDKAVVTPAPAPAAPAAAPPAKMVVVKGKFDVRSEGTTIAAPVMPVTAHQFVRDDGTQLADNTGSPLGNSTARDAEMISHYEQLISLWIQKFKLYPAEARAAGMQGETVVRIRIDRHGNIRYYMLENSTGYPALDHAAIDMIRRANPVPAVPNDYPHGDLMEFLIPVSFRLEP